MAGLITRGNVYWATWYDDKGKNVRKSTGVHVKPMPEDKPATARELRKLAQVTADAMEATSKGALTAARAIAAVMAAAKVQEAPKVTVEEYATQWMATQTHKKSYATCRKAITRWLELSGPDIRRIPMEAYTTAMAQDYIMSLLDEVSSGTVDRDLAEIGACFNRAVNERVILTNPWHGARIPQGKRDKAQDKEPFSSDQLKIIFNKFPPEWRDMVAVCLLLGGQRLGDIATLRWEQVEWDRMLIKLTTQKTNRGMRKPIIPLLEAILRRRQGTMAGASDYVFPYAAARYHEAGGKTSKLSIEFTGLLRKHGIRADGDDDRDEVRARKGHRISALSFHSLRSTATTFLMDAGVPPEMVRHIVGHDDPRIERAHYYKPTREAEAAHVAQMAKLLGITEG